MNSMNELKNRDNFCLVLNRCIYFQKLKCAATILFIGLPAYKSDLKEGGSIFGFQFILDYASHDPEGEASKQSKASLLRIVVFFICQHLQKLTFDVGQIKMPAYRLAFDFFGGERGIRTLDKL